jgi:glycosyltransferase involved in cell wall biosynthesis
MDEIEVSVVICTFNRCDLLPGALQSLVEQSADGVRYEIVVVDNNSQDATPAVIRAFMASYPGLIRPVFETKQGISHARNAGVQNARGPLIAFTDDDVRVADNWVATIKRAFAEHPEINFVGGKVLPQWPTAPPAWLTAAHWSPLSLVDYGNVPFFVTQDNQLCLVGATLAVRKDIFRRFGLFSPDFQPNGGACGGEDHELFLRLWQGGERGLYLPGLMTVAAVQPERLGKRYHRRWHRGHGRLYAKARMQDFEKTHIGTLFGVPAHLYRQAITAVFGMGRELLGRNEEKAFLHETTLWFFLGYFGGRLKQRRIASVPQAQGSTKVLRNRHDLDAVKAGKPG